LAPKQGSKQVEVERSRNDAGEAPWELHCSRSGARARTPVPTLILSLPLAELVEGSFNHPSERLLEEVAIIFVISAELLLKRIFVQRLRSQLLDVIKTFAVVDLAIDLGVGCLHHRDHLVDVGFIVKDVAMAGDDCCE